MTLRWTERAGKDLLAIGRYIGRDSPTAASRWIQRLRRRAAAAAENPLAGRVVPEFQRDDIREVFLKTYRIVYLVGDDAVDVLTVFEGHRLVPRGVMPLEGE